MHIEKHSRLTETIAAVFIFLFVYTSLSKLGDLQSFRAAINQSRIVKPFASFLAWPIPCIELVIACLLIRPTSRKIGLWAAFGLAAVFTVYVGWMLIGQRSTLPCTCGGIISQLSWTAHLWVNAGLLLLALVGLSSSLKPNFLLQ